MAEHPVAHRLESFALGLDDAACRDHVQACDACRSYVDRFTHARAASEQDRDCNAQDFARRIRSLAEQQEGSAMRSWLGAWQRMVVALVPVALAAVALVVMVRRSDSPGPLQEPGVTVPSREPLREPGERFKGMMQIAAIVERNGRQERMSSSLQVQAHDRIRIELSLDQGQPVVVGVVGDDGTWLVLMESPWMEPGTHYSPDALRVDDPPTAGWIVAGVAAAVERARKTRDFGDVAVLRLVGTKTP